VFSCVISVPDGKPTITTAHNTSATSIHISWRAPPRDSIHGEFLGYRVAYRQRDRSAQPLKEINIRDPNVNVSTHEKAALWGRVSFSHGRRAGAMQFYCVPDGETSASYIFFNAPLQLGAAQLLPPLSLRVVVLQSWPGGRKLEKKLSQSHIGFNSDGVAPD
jgi:hypothetical protein